MDGRSGLRLPREHALPESAVQPPAGGPNTHLYIDICINVCTYIYINML